MRINYLFILLFFLFGCSRVYVNSLSHKKETINSFFKEIRNSENPSFRTLVCDVGDINQKSVEIFHDILLTKGLPDTSAYIVTENLKLMENIYQTQFEVNLIDTSENNKKYIYAKAHFFFSDGLCIQRIKFVTLEWFPRDFPGFE